MLKHYYSLTKPGLVYGNAITVAGGFLLASKGYVDLPAFVAALVGVALVMASGCVFNNYIDRDIDGLMERTKDRVLVRHLIPLSHASIFGGVLGILGLAVLVRYTTLLAALVALGGFVFYVVLYSLWGKRHTVYGTLIGSVSGAVPPVAGYCAASGQFDAAALILFFMLVLWQMPHAYAIAVYRMSDYAAAALPVLPLKRGLRLTKLSMTLYPVVFTATALMLSVLEYTGQVYVWITLLLGAGWTLLGARGFWTADDRKWARKMFFYSIVVMVTVFVMIAVDAFLH